MAVSARLRFEVLRRDGYRCRYCGAPASEQRLTVDHVMPVTLGGADELGNLVACCPDCNAGKSSSMPEPALVLTVEREAAEWDAIQARFRRQVSAELDFILAQLDELVHQDDDGVSNDLNRSRHADRLHDAFGGELPERTVDTLYAVQRVADAFHAYHGAAHHLLTAGYPVDDVRAAANYLRAEFPDLCVDGASVADYRGYLISTLVQRAHAGKANDHRLPNVRYPQLDFMEQFVRVLVRDLGFGNEMRDIAAAAMWSAAKGAFAHYHAEEAIRVGSTTAQDAYEDTIEALEFCCFDELRTIREAINPVPATDDKVFG